MVWICEWATWRRARAGSARAIHDSAVRGGLKIESAVMVSNNSSSQALRWAQDADVPTRHLSGRTHPDPAALDRAIRDALAEHEVEIVVLSGYPKVIGPVTLARFDNRILNIHPAPLPEFGGQGMYGLAVHQAVLAAGRPKAAVTVHLIDGCYDHGPTVAAFPVEVLPDDTPEPLRARTHEREGACYTDVLVRIAAGEVNLDVIAMRQPPTGSSSRLLGREVPSY